jgi:hypothetical protein
MGLEYFNTRGTSGEQSPEENNPLNPGFVPMGKRTANSAARWWAIDAKKFRMSMASETSFEKVIDKDEDLC